MPRATFKDVIPVLPVRRMGDALPFYVGKLGFEVAFGDVHDPDTNYVGLRRDGMRIHLQFQFDGDFRKGTAGVAMLRFGSTIPTRCSRSSASVGRCLKGRR